LIQEEIKRRLNSGNACYHSVQNQIPDGMTGGWRKLHNEELHNMFSSRSINRIIKSRKMRWVGQVARMGEKRNVYRLLVGKQGEGDH
jgi:hypothetical protein